MSNWNDPLKNKSMLVYTLFDALASVTLLVHITDNKFLKAQSIQHEILEMLNESFPRLPSELDVLFPPSIPQPIKFTLVTVIHADIVNFVGLYGMHVHVRDVMVKHTMATISWCTF